MQPEKKLEEDKGNSRSVEKENMELEKKESKKNSPSIVKEYVPRVPYPARLNQSKTKEQFDKFLDLFKQLHINIPIIEAL